MLNIFVLGSLLVLFIDSTSALYSFDNSFNESSMSPYSSANYVFACISFPSLITALSIAESL